LLTGGAGQQVTSEGSHKDVPRGEGGGGRGYPPPPPAGQINPPRGEIHRSECEISPDGEIHRPDGEIHRPDGQPERLSVRQMREKADMQMAANRNARNRMQNDAPEFKPHHQASAQARHTPFNPGLKLV
jgi:hypothetical protein